MALRFGAPPAFPEVNVMWGAWIVAFALSREPDAQTVKAREEARAGLDELDARLRATARRAESARGRWPGATLHLAEAMVGLVREGRRVPWAELRLVPFDDRDLPRNMFRYHN